MKNSWKPGTMIYPLPAVMVSCGASPDEYNIITIAWTGTICSEPAMCYISVRPQRHSYDIIRKNGCFTINLTTSRMVYETDWCGVRSGKDFNKFEHSGLTPVPSELIASPSILESPVSIECKVTNIIPLGSHDMFMAEVVNVLVDDKYLDKKTGKLDLQKAGLMAYSHGEYYKLGELIGTFGYSVKGSTINKEKRNGRKTAKISGRVRK